MKPNPGNVWEYGNAPVMCGRWEFREWKEYMSYLYLPVGFYPIEAGVYLEPRLRFLKPLIANIVEWERQTKKWPEFYVYVTAKHGYATPGNPLNRPGWHSDGFGSQDINYVWTDRFPTAFAVQEFKNISSDHIESARQFEAQVDYGRVVYYPDSVLLRLDPSVIHAAPQVPPPGGDRRFLKISLSPNKYNLEGNSHNYEYPYEWSMWPRETVRNHPCYAGGDAGPQ